MKYFKFYLLITFIISFIGGFFSCLTINTASANTNKFTSIENIQRVNYENVYVDGNRYIVFSNGSDIEVVKP